MSRRGPCASLLVSSVLALGVILSAAPSHATPPLPARFTPYGMDAWDYWFAEVDGVFHAFYLQAPIDAPVRYADPTIGMARSADLLHWTEYGQVIAPNPPGSEWGDVGVATGSTFRGPAHWMMVFTAISSGVSRGIGLAQSDDLEHWTKLNNFGPLPLTSHPFVVPTSTYWQSRGFTAGTELNYKFIADPYVLPEPIDGLYYMVVSGLLTDESLSFRGCTALLKSPDAVHWEDVGLISVPRLYDECEAPQLFRRGDRWHLLFGAARSNPVFRATMVYTADTIEGPFEPPPTPEITLPEPGWFYVGKVFPDGRGQDVLMAYASGALSRPYPVDYEFDGSLKIGVYDAGVPQWIPNGLAAYTGPVVTDLEGGVVTNGAWHLNGNGYPIWGPVAATPATTWVSDSLGGAIGVWAAASDVFAVRTAFDGTRPWGASVTVSSAAFTQLNPTVVPDGTGGAFVAWMDIRNGTHYDIYAQHLNAAGVPVWTANGVAVCTAAGQQSGPVIVPDASGGAIVAWQDERPIAVGGSDIYGQRLNASGAPLWTANGVALAAVTGLQQAPVAYKDGSGGAFVAWWDARGGANDVYVQRVHASGLATWATNGVLVGSGPNDQLLPALIGDGAQGVFVAWEDHRVGGAAGLDIFCQHLGPSGATLWAAPTQVCVNGYEQIRPSIVSDRAGGVIVAWMDARDDTSATQIYFAPYAQRLNGAGVPQWATNGVRIEITPGTTTMAAPSICDDGAGGVYVAGTAGLQRVLADGRVAWMDSWAPTLVSVEDVPADEGGHVVITLLQPIAEARQMTPEIVGYDVWRKTGPSAAVWPPNGWELVGSYLSPPGPTYTLIVPTRSDSTILGPADETYIATSHTTGPKLIAPSATASGHSLDNLPPVPPSGLIAGYTGSGIRLVWTPNLEHDIAHYEVFKGSSESFVAAPENRIGQPTQSTFEDHLVPPDSLTFYRVVAVDRHGNASATVLIGPSQFSATPPGVGPPTSFLGRVSPNPIVSHARIEYGVARRGAVSLDVYDLAGRRVRQLVSGRSEPGVWNVAWDGRDDRDRRLPAGVYLVRFVGEGVRSSTKVVSGY